MGNDKTGKDKEAYGDLTKAMGAELNPTRPPIPDDLRVPTKPVTIPTQPASSNTETTDKKE